MAPARADAESRVRPHCAARGDDRVRRPRHSRPHPGRHRSARAGAGTRRQVFPELSVEDNLRVGPSSTGGPRCARASTRSIAASRDSRSGGSAGTLWAASSAPPSAALVGAAQALARRVAVGSSTMVAEVMRPFAAFSATRRDRLPRRAKRQPGVAPGRPGLRHARRAGITAMSGSGAQLLADERVRESYLGAKTTSSGERACG